MDKMLWLWLVVLILCSSSQASDREESQRRQQRYSHSANNVSQNDYVNRIFGSLQTSSNDIQHKLSELDDKVSRIEVEARNGFAYMRNALDQEASSATLKHVKREIEAVRQEVASFANKRQVDDAPSSLESDCSTKLTAIATLLTSTRSAVAVLQKDFTRITTNMSQLLALSSDIHKRQHNLPTKQYLNGVLYGSSSHQRIPPVYGIVNNLPRLGSSCAHLTTSPSSASDIEIHRIQVPTVPEPFFVLCDQETQEGGWTVIQQRLDGTINFNRNWLEYKNGFGNIAGEFFIGLDKLHAMTTSALCELLIVMEDFENNTRFAKYSAFAIAGEKEDYAMNLLGGYEGTAGDSFTFSASYKFSTFDNDNDGWVEGNCAQAHTGAWWFNACEMSNLNGQYLGGGEGSGKISSNNKFQGIYWNTFNGDEYSLKTTKMMIRPVALL